ncbi:MAG: polysaccharide biosynthesis protein [Firmicutes bacterium]|nr:polysaccharide biosynthesis protein [Bacillota bacterium]
MSAKRGNSFVHQAAILAAASLFVRFIGFLYRIPFTNWIGDIGIDNYNTAYQIYTFAIAVSSGALPVAVSRLVSERIAKKQYHNAHQMFKIAMMFALVLGGLAGLIVGFGANFFAGLLNAPEAALATRTLAPTLVVVAMLAVFRGYFQGMKTAVPTAISQVVEQILKVVITLWLARMFRDAISIQYAVAGGTIGTGVAAVAGLAVVAFLYALVAKDLRNRSNNDVNRYTEENKMTQIRAIFSTALPMILAMVIFSVSGFLDLRMTISRMVGSGAFTIEEAQALRGQFTGKFILLTTLPVALSVALSAAVIPEITSSSVKMDTGAVKRKTNTALHLSMILSIPSAVGLAVLADPIIGLLFPRAPEGGWLLRYGAVSIVFMALVHVLTGTLQGLGHVKLPVIAAFVGVLTKIPVNHFLIGIPSINILGAVISTVVCFAVAAAINMYFLYRHTGILPNLTGAFIKPTVAATGMGMVCHIVHIVISTFAPTAIATIAALGIGAMSYVVFMCLIKGFRKSDLQAAPLPGKIRRLLQKL